MGACRSAAPTKHERCSATRCAGCTQVYGRRHTDAKFFHTQVDRPSHGQTGASELASTLAPVAITEPALSHQGRFATPCGIAVSSVAALARPRGASHMPRVAQVATHAARPLASTHRAEHQHHADSAPSIAPVASVVTANARITLHTSWIAQPLPPVSLRGRSIAIIRALAAAA